MKATVDKLSAKPELIGRVVHSFLVEIHLCGSIARSSNEYRIKKSRSTHWPCLIGEQSQPATVLTVLLL